MKVDPTHPDVLDLARQCARLGFTDELTAEALDVDLPTLQRWRRRGLSGDASLYPMARALVDGSTSGARGALAQVHRAAREDWRAAAWLLERRWGYVKREDIHLGQVAPVEATEEEIARELVEVLRGAGRPAQGDQG